MNRRHFFRRTAGLAVLPLAGTLLGACGKGDPDSGPVDIAWGEEQCERCRMVISDRRNAAQVRDPAGEVHRFDDFGCAVVYMQRQGWPEEGTEFWVTDVKTGLWIHARKARYLPGSKTPMGYGLAATTVPGEQDLEYPEARVAVLASGR